MLPPQPGLLWTPAYWGWRGGQYVYNAGYWGPTVGFYGGVNYGFGYTGSGFVGGYWRNGGFFYNTAVANIGNTNITNVYSNNVTVNQTVNNVSYNGGQGGLTAQPTAAERAAANEPHVAPTPAQTQHVEAARADKSLTASANHGVPPIAATSTAGNFKGPGVNHAATFGAAAGAAAVGAHALSPSVAVPHGISNAHALPVPAGAGGAPAAPQAATNNHALPVPPHPAASAGGAQALAPQGTASQRATQPASHPVQSVDHALPTSAYQGAAHNNAVAAPHPMAAPTAAPLEPHVGTAPPQVPRPAGPGPQAAGAPQGQRQGSGKPPAAAPHPAAAHPRSQQHPHG